MPSNMFSPERLRVKELHKKILKLVSFIILGELLMKRFVLTHFIVCCLFCVPVKAQWTQTGTYPASQTWVESFAASGTNIYAGTHTNGVFLSTNNGTNWTAVPTGLPVSSIKYSMAISGEKVFAGTDNNYGVYTSINNGAGWVQSGLTGIAIKTILVSGTNIYVGTSGYGIYLSANNGAGWNPINTGLSNMYVTSFASIGSNLFAGTLGGTNYGVFLSTDNGATWVRQANGGLPNLNITALAAVGSSLFAGTSTSGIYRSTDNGVNWATVNAGLTVNNINALLVSGSNLFAATYGGGIFMTADNGNNWQSVNTGLSNMYVFSLLIYNGSIFAGTMMSGIWRRSLSELVTSAEDLQVTPAGFILEQNYPNPFNPATIIKYTIPMNSIVSLKVYNIHGEEVATLVNEEKTAGTYNAEFVSSNLPTGVYVYKLCAGGFVYTKKMLVLK